MSRSLCACVVGLLFVGAMADNCSAAVSQRDWKSPGDGLLTYDDVNHREWLDIPESLMVKFPGNSLTAKFQNAIAELGNGGVFEGFALANSSEIDALAHSAGIDTATTDYSVNYLTTEALVNLLGATRSIESGGEVATGFLNELGGTPPICPCQRTTSLLFDTSRNMAGVTYSNSIGGLDAPFVYSIVGLMLYRPVPEPSSLCMAAAAISFLILRRNRGK